MKIEIKDNQIFVDGKYDGFFSPSDKVVAELARRVNGWEGLVAFVRSVAEISCLDPNAQVATDGVCLSCLAVKVLREAGCEC